MAIRSSWANGDELDGPDLNDTFQNKITRNIANASGITSCVNGVDTTLATIAMPALGFESIIIQFMAYGELGNLSLCISNTAASFVSSSFVDTGAQTHMLKVEFVYSYDGVPNYWAIFQKGAAGTTAITNNGDFDFTVAENLYFVVRNTHGSDQNIKYMIKVNVIGLDSNVYI